MDGGKMMKNWKELLFFGALWGLTEATLGFFLHLVAVPITGLVMFPIGFFFMWQARLRTDSVYAPMQVAAVAASIKLVNLFVTPLWMTAVNPAVAILLEGVFVFVFIASAEQKTPIRCLLATYGWRVGYLAFLFALLAAGFELRLLNGGWASILPYVTIDALVNASLVLIIAKYSRKFNSNLKPVLVGATAFAAVVATVVL
jgi:hypothetical protein